MNILNIAELHNDEGGKFHSVCVLLPLKVFKMKEQKLLQK